jgi:hypothetical protein
MRGEATWSFPISRPRRPYFLTTSKLGLRLLTSAQPGTLFYLEYFKCGYRTDTTLPNIPTIDLSRFLSGRASVDSLY